jgi:hypothetical protein
MIGLLYWKEIVKFAKNSMHCLRIEYQKPNIRSNKELVPVLLAYLQAQGRKYFKDPPKVEVQNNEVEFKISLKGPNLDITLSHEKGKELVFEVKGPQPLLVRDATRGMELGLTE